MIRNNPKGLILLIFPLKEKIKVPVPLEGNLVLATILNNKKHSQLGRRNYNNKYNRKSISLMISQKKSLFKKFLIRKFITKK